jgi:hypothetical protein
MIPRSSCGRRKRKEKCLVGLGAFNGEANRLCEKVEVKDEDEEEYM